MEVESNYNELTRDDLYDILKRVENKINGWRDYYTSSFVTNVQWRDLLIYISIHFNNSQGYGYEWDEDWMINEEGKIYTSGEVFENIDEFEQHYV